ncbi:hypothetical protein SAMN05443551_1425 [Marivita hallyeonensis]|uniref:CBU-0592-like domain-containing protein n=1 Tax=Marivita hallyeonensis TaxID=996342 RepID=A0A1M5QNY5_9RHOB|nr:hypothetical protein SAMN05443551_1425 [Marivita hallyeonensis]
MSGVLDYMRTYPDLLQASGVLGSIIYVGGFALVQSGRACGNGATYSASKIVAALLVLISLVGAFNLGAFLIQIGFIFFGTWGLFRRSGTLPPQDGVVHARLDGTRLVTQPSANGQIAPASPDDLPAISGSESHQPAPAGGKSARLFLGDAGPAL